MTRVKAGKLISSFQGQEAEIKHSDRTHISLALQLVIIRKFGKGHGVGKIRKCSFLDLHFLFEINVMF